MPSTHTSLQYHVVFSTKDRYPFIDIVWRDRLHEYIGGCLRSLDVKPLGIGGVADHVHILLGAKPAHALSDVVREAKKASTAWVRQVFRPKFAWQEGYGAFTLGRADLSSLIAYVMKQEEHHRTMTYQEEYVAFLRNEGIEHDPKYLW
jgi:putative transposase